ncbi:hypothetical protein E2C01_007112 [Portunus trituberculatus]|uniref:Uncharacterized protein n=1 Tax=Portunus trituberculatus TaxID=210409 RepID=A0A5B7CYJ9_PORTR|nr:hypothetical protein [Portunus trituberculatus]
MNNNEFGQLIFSTRITSLWPRQKNPSLVNSDNLNSTRCNGPVKLSLPPSTPRPPVPQKSSILLLLLFCSPLAQRWRSMSQVTVSYLGHLTDSLPILYNDQEPHSSHGPHFRHRSLPVSALLAPPPSIFNPCIDLDRSFPNSSALPWDHKHISNMYS